MNDENIVTSILKDSINAKKDLINNHNTISLICELAQCIVNILKDGGKIVLCGNGGSASDALHFAGEIVGRFQDDHRPSWPAIALNADVATMTAIANDYGYENVFMRQAQGQLRNKDIIIGISTSGESENVIRAIQYAKSRKVKTAALLGKDGGRLKDLVDYPIIVNNNVTARIQECHICIIHILCELIEIEMKEYE